MAPRLKPLSPLVLALFALPALPIRATPPDAGRTSGLEREAAAAALAGKWSEVLPLLARLREADSLRYADGRFDYLAARALEKTGRPDEALKRFERYIAPGDLFDVPARLAAGSIRFSRGDGFGALELLAPLLSRRNGAVSRRAVRIALNALETKLDPAVLQRLVAARPATPPRERRRLEALRAEALELAGAEGEAGSLRLSILSEARRDDAAAIVLARELRGRTPETLPDRLLALLTDTARAQRDLDLAERLATERDRRAFHRPEPIERLAARFDLARLKAGRGKFADARSAFESLLALKPRPLRPPRTKKDDAPGTPAFYARVRFNLGAVLEKLGEPDAAAHEFQRVEIERVGPTGLAALQRARLELRRGRLDLAEGLLLRASLSREPGRIEGLLLLAERRAGAGDARGAQRALFPIDVLARARRLPEPWRSELPFWHGRAAEAAGEPRAALAAYAELLAAHPYSAAGEITLARIAALEPGARAAFLREGRATGEALLSRGEARAARDKLLPPALLGDAAARDLLKIAYQKLPGYAEVLLAPELPDEALPTLCGDAGACRLLQLGLPEEAEPVVRDARRLDTLYGCVLAARLAEGADAGPAALEAADALDRRIPDDFLLDLAPRAIVRALAPRPFDRLVAEAAAESGVPRELLYAVMRQESRFDHEAASPAAARGLMQLTLPTAGEAARELNEEPPAYMDLYDPARSLRLGGRTLRTLLARFQGDAAASVSAYNAGAGQTALWCGGSKAPSEALLAAISYPETRTYFRRVLANRLLYRLSEAVPAAPAAADGPRR